MLHPFFEKWFSINLNYSYAQLWRHFASLLPRKVLTNFGRSRAFLSCVSVTVTPIFVNSVP